MLRNIHLFRNLLANPSRLPDQYQLKIRDILVSNVIQFLATSRPIGCNRLEFFVHAEVFAVLIKIDFIPITSAVVTIVRLLSRPETCSAAITMLGKTIEWCLAQVREKCDKRQLMELQRALSQVRFHLKTHHISSNRIETNHATTDHRSKFFL